MPRYAYSNLLDHTPPEKSLNFWNNLFNFDAEKQDWEWKDIHTCNFKCTIETKLRSFYFTLFHRAIALNVFLQKIGRKDTPICSSCCNPRETFVHLFCECDKVKPIWQELQHFINTKCHSDYDYNNFDKLFGFPQERWLTYILLCCKFYIYCLNIKMTPQALGLLSLFLLLNVTWNIIWLRKMVNCPFILKSGVLI